MAQFMEADHLDGDTDMVALVETLLEEQQRRKAANLSNWRIPMRPDHVTNCSTMSAKRRIPAIRLSDN